MIDTGLIVKELKRRGHAVGNVIPLPENAGQWEFQIDGETLTLEQTRELMESEDQHAPTPVH